MTEFKYVVEISDVSHKYVDDTKTIAVLFLVNPLGYKTAMSHVLSSDSIKDVLHDKKHVEKLLIGVIRDNIVWEETE